MSNTQQASKQSRAKTARVPNTRLKAQRLKKNWTQVYVATMIVLAGAEWSARANLAISTEGTGFAADEQHC